MLSLTYLGGREREMRSAESVNMFISWYWCLLVLFCVQERTVCAVVYVCVCYEAVITGRE